MGVHLQGCPHTKKQPSRIGRKRKGSRREPVGNQPERPSDEKTPPSTSGSQVVVAVCLLHLISFDFFQKKLAMRMRNIANNVTCPARNKYRRNILKDHVQYHMTWKNEE